MSAGANGSYYFDFPVGSGSVNYVMLNDTAVLSKAVTANITVSTTGNPTFQYQLGDPSNTCVYPAHTRFMIQEKGDNFTGQGAYEFYRWWSIDPHSYELKAGSATLSAPVTDPSQWISVFGKAGNASAAATAGFTQALHNMAQVGFVFGGGCFYGHGVQVTGGTARFIINSFGAT